LQKSPEALLRSQDLAKKSLIHAQSCFSEFPGI